VALPPNPLPARLARALACLAALCLALVALPAAASAAPTELFFSEYVEGSGNNKALEVYNGTAAPVTLTGVYDVQIFANGSTTATATIGLTGTVAPGDVFVLARSLADPAVLAVADQTTTNFLYNGNDAVALRNAGVVVDIIGQVGTDPGVEWGSGDASTADNTLRRLPAVEEGDLDGSDPFDPSSQWSGLPTDTFDGLGAHTTGGGGGGGGGGNHEPVAVDDTFSIAEDSGAGAVGALANDSDPDGDTLAFTGASDPAHGSITVLAGVLTYAPDADYAGRDSFTYSISDGRGGTASAAVAVTVTPVNDSPIAVDDSASVAAGGDEIIDVLANDSPGPGEAGQPLTVVSVGAPAHGVAEIVSGGPDAGKIRYTPASGQEGPDTFAYTVSDGEATAVGHVTVTVASLPADPRCDSPRAILGTTGDDHIVGTPGDDVIRGQRGDDTIDGAGGNDVICGGAGDDRITTLAGDDWIAGGAGNDTIRAGAGDNRVGGSSGEDVIETGAGDDTIGAGSEDDVIDAGDGANDVTASAGDDRIRTGAGDDRIRGGAGIDSCDAGAGQNVVKSCE
jgi:Ca2+-binding RTX toxin-like protein